MSTKIKGFRRGTRKEDKIKKFKKIRIDKKRRTKYIKEENLA